VTVQVPFFETSSSARSSFATLTNNSLHDGFGVSTFVANFEALATAAGGAAGLRRLILDLSVRGRLTSPTARARAGDGPFAIPDHWTWGQGEEVFAFVTSGSRGWAAYYAADGPLFLRIGNLDYETTDLDLRIVQHVRPPKNAEGVRTRVEAGDILISITGDTGMVGLAPLDLGEAYINQHIALARPSAKVSPAFVARALTAPSLLGRLQSAQRGIKNSLGLDDVRKLAVPLPPLAEQKLIVARVGQLMALIDDLEAKQTKKRALSTRFTKASLEALTTAESPEAFDTAWQRVVENFPTVLEAAQNVGELRKSVCELAVRGGLGTRSSVDVDAAQLLAEVARARAALIELGKLRRSKVDESVLGVEKPFTVPPTWTWTQVGDTFDVVGGIQKTPLRTPRKNHYPYLRVENVQRNRLNLERMERFELQDGELERWRLSRGDLLVVEGNGSESEIGRCALWDGAIDDCVHQNHLIRCRPIGSIWSPFLLLFLNSPSGATEMRKLAITTSGLYSLSVGKIRGIWWPVPPLAEQKRIVAKVERLMKLCDDLEAKLRRAEDRASKLVEAVAQEMVA
jgi:type I restriction enzyme, S subunit